MSIESRPIDLEEVDALRAIVEGTARSTGSALFETLVRHLALALNVSRAFVAEFAGTETRVRTLAFWEHGEIRPNVEYDLAGHPCEDVVKTGLCHYPSRVWESFPNDPGLKTLGIESYLGVPLLDAEGLPLGHLAVLDERPMADQPRRLFTFRIFAARAAVELERLSAERRLIESERRYRDLYDDAPNAYVSMTPTGLLTNANRRVSQWFRCDPTELVGRSWFDLLVESPAGLRRAREAWTKCLAGEELSGIELELKGPSAESFWLDVSLKPSLGLDGEVRAVRSVWLDVTARVLAENERARLHQQNLYLQEELKSVHNFEEIIGRSPALRAVLEKVERVAPTDATVLILGETGTGKELFARAIHSHGKRAGKPLIKVNCAALPTGLVESELFGHEKGAFTGAISKRIGRFELAEGGTVFLDEIGELPLETQAKLLRILQEREFERVGGTSTIKVDVRVIAATNRDLRKAVAEKTFREDLYYRLSVFPIALPPLRERLGDIPLLAEFLVGKFAAKVGRRFTGIDQATMKRLIAYPWPGNVRELENVLERGVILAPGPSFEIDPDVLPDPRPVSSGSSETSLETVERGHILDTLKKTDWVIEGPKGAALLLGLHPNTLRSRLKKLGIDRVDHEGS